jgi:hypothetical protein
MSIELHILFSGKLPSKAAVQRSLRELGFPLTFRRGSGALDEQHGMLPMMLNRQETGVEFDTYHGDDVTDEILPNGAPVDRALNCRVSLRWSGDFTEAVTGMCIGAAIAKLVDGLVIDEFEEGPLSADAAVALARKNFAILMNEQSPRTPGTTPRDLKRYLKPLLDLRPDLTLIGRHLIIRPVRHILRGALFDRTSDKYAFNVYRYVLPLYDDIRTVGWGDSIAAPWRVYEPYFEPLLFDVLRNDIFNELGDLLTLQDFVIAFQDKNGSRIGRIIALLLAGERERAALLVDEVRRDEKEQRYLETAQLLLDWDTADLCAKYREREAANAKQLKLAKVWECSPFPAEVPAPERSMMSEPKFLDTPWIDSAPHLWEKLPENVGSVRFAEFIYWRKGQQLLGQPLSFEQAKEFHRAHRRYVVACRLSPRTFALVDFYTFWSPHSPDQPTNPDYVPSRNLYLSITTDGIRISARFHEDLDAPEQLDLSSIEVFAEDSSSVIYIFYSQREREKTVRDYRPGGQPYARNAMTDAELDQLRLPVPQAGEVEALVQHVNRCLANEGYPA